MRELGPGLWHWNAPHPEWRSSEPWDQNVSSYAIDDGERLLLFDPLAPPSEIDELAATRETAIVLTCPWHERDARSLVQRLGAPMFTPAPDSQEYLMQKFGLTAEQAADSPDVRWLLAGEGEGHLYSFSDELPAGIEAFPGHKYNDFVLWIAGHRAAIAGDTLVDFGRGVQINDRWLSEEVTREQVVEGYARCSGCPWSTCSPRTAGLSTGPPSNARCPNRTCR